MHTLPLCIIPIICIFYLYILSVSLCIRLLLIVDANTAVSSLVWVHNLQGKNNRIYVFHWLNFYQKIAVLCSYNTNNTLKRLSTIYIKSILGSSGFLCRCWATLLPPGLKELNELLDFELRPSSGPQLTVIFVSRLIQWLLCQLVNSYFYHTCAYLAMIPPTNGSCSCRLTHAAPARIVEDAGSRWPTQPRALQP